MADKVSSTRHLDEVEDKKNEAGWDDQLVWLVALVLAGVFLPAAAVAAGAVYLAFAWQRVKIAAITYTVALPYALLLLIFHQPLLNWVKGVIENIILATQNQTFEFWAAYIQWVLASSPFAGFVGVSIGLGYSFQRWRTRPKWLQTKYRLTPLELLRKNRTIRDIKQNKNTPFEAMTLGVDERGQRVLQTDAEAATHTFVVGASGAGKTTTLMSRLRDALQNGQGTIIIDLKGSQDIPQRAYELATRTNKKFQHWVIQPTNEPYRGPAPEGPAYYDPLGRGDATRRKDLLIGSREWTETYYRDEASAYAQLAFRVLIANPSKEEISVLEDFLSLLTPERLHERAIPLATQREHQGTVASVNALVNEKISDGKKKSIENLRTQIDLLFNSTAGQHLRIDSDRERRNDIDLFRSAHDGDVVVFSLDASNYPELAGMIANLLIQDLKTVSSELRNDPIERPFQVIVDEFSAIGSDNIIGLVSKSRDAKMPVTLSTQALGDLTRESPAFKDQIIGNISSYIIHRATDYGDAEVFASLTGKEKKQKFNEGVAYESGIMSTGSGTGKGTLTEMEDYVVSPSVIQSLGAGEMVYVSRARHPQRQIRTLVIPEQLEDGAESSTFKVSKFKSREPKGDGSISYVSEEPTFDFSTEGEVKLPSAPGELPDSEFEESVVTHKPDMDRLRAILNRDPNELLGTAAKNDPGFVSKAMPPRKAEPLVPTEGSLPALPSLPTLPPRSSDPSSPSAPTPGAATNPKATPTETEQTTKVAHTPPPSLVLPSLPSLPPAPQRPISPKEPLKDDLDF